jgi:hypothetical protein
LVKPEEERNQRRDLLMVAIAGIIFLGVVFTACVYVRCAATRAAAGGNTASSYGVRYSAGTRRL